MAGVHLLVQRKIIKVPHARIPGQDFHEGSRFHSHPKRGQEYTKSPKTKISTPAPPIPPPTHDPMSVLHNRDLYYTIDICTTQSISVLHLRYLYYTIDICTTLSISVLDNRYLY